MEIMAEQSLSKSMIELIKVGKSYPPSVQALDGVCLSIKKGELVFITGRSGAGKTTLLRLLCGIEKPSNGLVEIDNMDLNRLSNQRLQQLRRKIGMACQEFKLLPEQSVAGNIAMAMEVSYRKKSFIRRQIKILLEKLGIKDKINEKTGNLSRGEQQRVAIARALANNPNLVLADEPTGNLDGEASEMVMDLFRYYQQRGATILIATHDIAIMCSIHARRIIELDDGRIVNDSGIPKSILQ
jgi:cell division transport system ATP-binding protein